MTRSWELTEGSRVRAKAKTGKRLKTLFIAATSGSRVHGMPSSTWSNILRTRSFRLKRGNKLRSRFNHLNEVPHESWQKISIKCPEPHSRFVIKCQNKTLKKTMTKEENDLTKTPKPVVISSTFDVPRERMWKAWTDRDQLMQWFGPKGFKMTTAKLDFRSGGIFHYCLRSPDGKEMWGKFLYREIVEPKRVVVVSSFSDEAGGITRHPMAPTWPREMLSTFTLKDEDGKTTVQIEWIPLNPTAEELKTFDSSHEGMKQGWSGTFDQLAEYLAKG
jgi:uncharacterized protein YndB with AHSA1/START domain